MHAQHQYWYEQIDSAGKPGRLWQMFPTVLNFVQETLRLERGKEVCIVTDTETSSLLSSCLAGAIRSVGGVPTVAIMEPVAVPGAEPPASVRAAMLNADFVISCCSRSITHSDAAHAAYLEGGVKFVVMSNANEDMFVRGAATAEFSIVRDISVKTRDALNKGTIVRITSADGTDVRFDCTGRPFSAHYGEFVEDSTVTVFPGGEVNTAPREDSGEGVIVFDAFMMEVGLLSAPIIWHLREGRITTIEGGLEADAFRRLLDTEGDAYSRLIGELAVGTNYAARSVGNSLEDKEVYGSVHVACGTSVSAADRTWRGTVQSRLHLDGVISRPTVTVDGVVVVDRGEILVAPRPVFAAS